MPNRRYNFTPSCSNSITNSCRCDMIDFSDHGTPAPPQQAKDADRMCQPCLRTPVHDLSGLYTLQERGSRYTIVLQPLSRIAGEGAERSEGGEGVPSAGREMRAERLRRLGMGRRITRRDFIDGIAFTAAIAASAPVLGAIDPGEAIIAPQDRPEDRKS